MPHVAWARVSAKSKASCGPRGNQNGSLPNFFNFPVTTFGARVHLKTSGKKLFATFRAHVVIAVELAVLQTGPVDLPRFSYSTCMEQSVDGRRRFLSHCIPLFHSSNTHLQSPLHLQSPFLGACLVLSSKKPPTSPPNAHFLFISANHTHRPSPSSRPFSIPYIKTTTTPCYPFLATSPVHTPSPHLTPYPASRSPFTLFTFILPFRIILS